MHRKTALGPCVGLSGATPTPVSLQTSVIYASTLYHGAGLGWARVLSARGNCGRHGVTMVAARVRVTAPGVAAGHKGVMRVQVRVGDNGTAPALANKVL